MYLYVHIHIYVYIQSTAARMNQPQPISRPFLRSVDCMRWPRHPPPEEGRCKATWKMEFKLSWRKAGPFNHHDYKADSD